MGPGETTKYCVPCVSCVSSVLVCVSGVVLMSFAGGVCVCVSDRGEDRKRVSGTFCNNCETHLH